MKRFVLLAAVLLASCTEKVSFETLEDARRQARENATVNAQDFRTGNAEYVSCGIGSAGDSTQSRDCPQGDGWASLTLKCASGPVKLKCSTVSNAVGCVEEETFKSRPYATEENRCNLDIPTTLPKIEK